MNIIMIILSAASISFSHLNYMDGMTTGSVTDIWFDEKGMVWIGTGNGLNLYDGNTVTPIIFEPGTTGTHSNSVMRLAGDGDGKLYVACRGELYSVDCRERSFRTISQDDSRAIACLDGILYVATGNRIKRYVPGKDLPETVAVFNDNDDITAIAIPSHDRILAGTKGGEIIRFNPGIGSGRRWDAGSFVENLYADDDGSLWAATMSDGLFRISGDGSTTRYRHIPGDPSSLSSDFVRSMCRDDMGKMWVGTFNGLDCLDPESGRFRHFKTDFLRDDSLSDASVWCVRKDAQGTIWAGTFFGGVNYFHPEYEVFTTYRLSNIEGEGLSSENVSDIAVTDDGLVVIGTEGGGCNILDPATGRTVWYIRDASPGRALSERNAKAVVPDGEHGCIWVGTHLGGITRIDTRTWKASPFRRPGQRGGDPLTDDVICMADRSDSLAVGTTRGVFLMDKRDAGYRCLAQARNYSGGTVGIMAMEFDGTGDLWFSDNGLHRYSFKDGSLSSFIPGVQISDMAYCPDGRMCLCSNGQRGVLFFDPETGASTFRDLSGIWPESERPKGVAYSPHSGNLLITSSTGLTILGPSGEEATFFASGRGFPLALPGIATWACPDGTIYIGCMTGLASFREDDLKERRKPFGVTFSELFIDGEKVRPGSDVLPEALHWCSSITIPPGVSSFSIRFCDSNYIPANEAEFEYRMEGLSKNWETVWTGRDITFYNIPHGRYVLNLRAKGTPADECPPAVLKIRVRPPWYASALAWTLYVLLALFSIWSVLNRLISIVRRKEEARLEQLRRENKEHYKIFEQATSIVYHNLDNAEFSINDFANEMAMSRSGLFDKIKKATGYTPGDFMMNIRLSEAEKMLRNNPDLNVSDIADRVGFSSTNYFTKCFRSHFGQAPLSYRKTH